MSDGGTFGLGGTYGIILADPPWHFKSNSATKPGRNAMRHYDVMGLGEICRLPVAEIAAGDSLLLLWTTAPHLHHGLKVMKAWGFTYKTNMVWDKERQGTGFWVRNEHEHLLLGRRGRFPLPPNSVKPRSVLRGGRREHSRKPDELFAIIDRCWPDARKVELFARQTRRGWDCWGNETQKYGGRGE